MTTENSRLKKRFLSGIMLLLALAGCSPGPRNQVPAGVWPEIYPDYTGVEIPVNIAPP